MTVTKKLAATVLTLGLLGGTALVAAPASAAPTAATATKYRWVPKDFTGQFPANRDACVAFVYSPPPGVRTDQWRGCTYTQGGTYRAWYYRL